MQKGNIEARQEGTCERVLDITQHFLAWTSPHICDHFAFKQFGMPLQISPCTPSRDDTEIFSCTINIPWMREEAWRVISDDVILKNFLLTIK